MYTHPKHLMTNIQPPKFSLKVSKGLRQEGVLQQVVDCAVDQFKAYLGSSLSTHVDDVQLLIDLCSAVERCKSDTKFDKKVACIMVLKALFPGQIAQNEAALLKLATQIDVLHSYGLFERKSVLSRFGRLFASKKK